MIILVGAFLSGVYLLSDRSESVKETVFRVSHGLIMTAGLWIGCIIIVTWLWEKFPWQEYPIKHLLYEIVLILAYTIVFSSLIYLIEQNLFSYTTEINLVYDGFTTILITFFITAIHEAVFFYRQWKLHFSKSVKLQRDNIEANYEALRSQVNPHFLFNSLNSLTSMVDDNPQAVKYIANLSEFLRYLLKSNENELVALKDELAVVERYLELQGTRFGEALKVKFDIDAGQEFKNLPPLAVQMLVENCIKHNIISLDHPLSIKIYTEKDRLSVENNLNEKSGIISTKQGLKNIKDRYSLFTSLKPDIVKNDNIFKVTLPLLKIEE